jgi:SnoaL-like domain
MSAGNSRRLLARSGDRAILRAAVALGTVTMLGAVGVPVASAAPSAVPTCSAVSTPQASVDSDAEIEAIKQLKASYFANVDAKNWSALRELLAPDVVVDTTGSFGPIFYGRDPFVAFLALTLGALQTHHEGYDPQITLNSATSADVVWTMQDRLVFANLIGIHGYGHYTDHYEKVGDSWVIDRSKLTRTGLTIIVPGLDRFLSVFAETAKTDGPIVALVHAIIAVFNPDAVPAAAPSTTTVAQTVVSPADAEPTNAVATTSTASPKAFTLSTPPSTEADAAPSAADAVAAGGEHEGTDAPDDKPAEQVTTPDESTPTEPAEADQVEAEPEASEAKVDVEPKKTTSEAKVDVEPKKTTPEAKVDAEPKKTPEAKVDAEPKKTSSESKAGAEPEKTA